MAQQTSPDKAPWLGTQEGISDQVLAPWSAVQVEKGGQTIFVRVAGRSYEFDRLPFPNQIRTADRDVLSAPIRLIARADGREVSWTGGSLQLLEERPDHVRLSSTSSSETLDLSADIRIECDGVIRVDWKLEPRKATRLEALTFEIPLLAEHAKYLYCFMGTYWASKAPFLGLLPPVGYTSAFRPFIWLGDEERGLAWFCESDENWVAADRHLVTEIRRSYHSTTQATLVFLRLNLVCDPVDLVPSANPNASAQDGSGSGGKIQKQNCLTYTFGLQATPVKPITKDVWDYRLFHVDVTLSKYGVDTRLKVPDATLDQLAAAGVKTLAFHEHWTDIESYVTTTYGDDLKSLVKCCHQRGMQVLLYLGFLISDLAPEWPEYGDQCVTTPRGGYEPYDYPPQPKQNAYRVCYNSVWQDRLAAGIAELMDEYDIDGVYLDGTQYPSTCSNRRHGCGYVLADGSVASTCPIWAVRNMMKRIYHIVRSRKPDGQINVHNSTCMTIPTLGWATSYWDGEQFRELPNNTSVTEVLPLDAFRTEFMGHQWGVPAEFLSYEDRGILFHQAYSFTLLHDVLTRSYTVGPGLELNSALWRLSDEFGRKEAQWLPYWRNAEYVTVQPEGAYASLYRHPSNGVLAVVSNLRRDEAVLHTHLNLDRLGLTGRPSATDALARTPVTIDDDGRIELTLPSFGWRLLWIRGATPAR